MAKPRIIFDERADALIKKAYSTGNLRSGSVKAVSQKLGCSSATINRRAVELGVTRFGYKPNIRWAEAELELLDKHASKSLEYISLILVKNGYPKRGIESIRSALRRQGLGRRISKNDAGIYTQNDVARFLGCLKKTVYLHIKQGHLKVTVRKDVNQLEYLIKASDIKQFIINHISAIDMTKVDKYWLVDILTDAF